MIGGKLPTRPHTAPNSFRRGRILKAQDGHGSPEKANRRQSPGSGGSGRQGRVLKGSNIFNSKTSGGGGVSPRGRREEASAASTEGGPDKAAGQPLQQQRTVSPRSRRRMREMNGTYTNGGSPRLPGIGSPADMALNSSPRGRQRGPSPRRSQGAHGPAGNGISPRGMHSHSGAGSPGSGQQVRPFSSPQGAGGPRVWGTEPSPREASPNSSRASNSSSKPTSSKPSGSMSSRDRPGSNGQPASPPSSPPHSNSAADSEARDVGVDVAQTTHQAELHELQLDLEACRSAAAKAEAEKELAEVQSQVVQQECDMEMKRMARENQILQDELDEMKARFRSIQEEHDKKVRGKDRYIQVLTKALEVNGIASPLAATDGIDALTSRIEALADADTGCLRRDQFTDITTICGIPSFLETRLVEHARHASGAKADNDDIRAAEVAQMWRKRLYPLDTAQQMFRLLCNPSTPASECTTISTLQPVILQVLLSNPQLLSGTELREADPASLERVASVLAQRIMHFCCRGGVRRMTRYDYEASDLGEVLQILAEATTGASAPASQEKVAAFFAIEEADQVVKCFDRLDEDSDGFLDLQNMLAARNAGGEEGEAGLIPRCGAFTLTQAAIEGCFGRCAKGGSGNSLMDLNGFAELFHAYVYPHAPCALRFWFDVADADHDGRVKPADIERLLQEQVFILNTHLESQGEVPVFHLDNLMHQVMDMLGPPRGLASGEPSWCCAEVLSSRAGLVVFDILFNYEVLLRYERQATATGGQPYITCALSA